MARASATDECSPWFSATDAEFWLSQQKDGPEHIRILEVYADQEAYEAHLRSPHFLKYMTLTAAMVRSLRLIATEPILLRAKT